MDTGTLALITELSAFSERLAAVSLEVDAIKQLIEASRLDMNRLVQIENQLVDIAKAWMNITRSAQYGDGPIGNSVV